MSQKLNLDFVDNQPFSLQNFNVINLLIIIISLLILAYTTITYKTKTDEYNKLQAELVQIQPKKNQGQSNQNIEKISSAELKQIGDVVADLSTPWKLLLEGLGEIEMRDVALLSLEPSKKKQQLVWVVKPKTCKQHLTILKR
jgi:lipid II:glycine glycyltransferase (peptidoglycan interpeptide bridge formation enzyme)